MEWNIASRARACQGCGRGFRNQETLHTLLFDERQGYVRLDVCEACWTAQYSQGANHRKGFISHWQSAFTVPPPASAEPIGKETAETLLRKLLELNDVHHAGACFVLAVMLERKRLLKTKAHSVEEGRRVFHYEHVKTGDLFSIADPNLRLDQLAAVQRDVASLLEHGLTPPAPPAAAGQESATGLASPGTEPVAGSTPGPDTQTADPPAAAAAESGADTFLAQGATEGRVAAGQAQSGSKEGRPAQGGSAEADRTQRAT